MKAEKRNHEVSDNAQLVARNLQHVMRETRHPEKGGRESRGRGAQRGEKSVWAKRAFPKKRGRGIKNPRQTRETVNLWARRSNCSQKKDPHGFELTSVGQFDPWTTSGEAPTSGGT